MPFEYKVKPTQIEKQIPSKVSDTLVLKEIDSKIKLKAQDIEISKLEKSSLSVKTHKNKTDSISSDVPKTTQEIFDISHNSLDKSEANHSINENANKEIVFEVEPRGEEQKLYDSDMQKPPIDQNKKVSNIKDSSYESPQKCETEEDWNFKLPSIKSSSGNDHFRNSNSDHLIEVPKEKENESMSVELLEKSPEVTVFISEKELSPQNPFSSNKNSHKKSRIEYLRDKTNEMWQEENEEGDKNNSLELSVSQQLEAKEEDDEVLCASTRVMNNQNLLEKFEMMKEPGLDPV